MSIIRKAIASVKIASLTVFVSFISSNAFAADLLAEAVNGDVKDTFGAGSAFWKLFILADIIVAGTAAIKTKSPMVFAGVFIIVLVPGFLLKRFVFNS